MNKEKDKNDMDKLINFERGPLWRLVKYSTGLNSINLLNSKSIIGAEIFDYKGDYNYNFFHADIKELQLKIKEGNPDLFEKAKEKIELLGIKETKERPFDTYFGKLTSFAWHNTAIPNGAYFTPIYHQIEEINKKIPNQTNKLDAIRRRLVYLEILQEEFEYLMEKYDFKKLAIMKDWLTMKFEIFTTNVIQLALFIIKFFYQIHPEYNLEKRLYFEDIINHLKPIDNIFNTVNFTMEGFLGVILRNNIIHSEGYLLKIIDENIIIEIEEEPIKDKIKFGVIKDIIKIDIIKPFKGKKTPEKTVSIPYDKFPYATFRIYVSKQNNLIFDTAIISYKFELIEYVKTMHHFIFFISQKLFSNLLSLPK